MVATSSPKTTVWSPKNMEVPKTHFLEGGSGITNFPPKQLPLYEAAIAEFHRNRWNKKLVWVEFKPYDGLPTCIPTDYSLHKDRDNVQSVQPFWDIYDKLKKDFPQCAY